MNFSTVVRRCLPQAVVVMAPNPKVLEKMRKNPDMDVPEAMGIGSGFFLDAGGHIVTNHHVIDQGDPSHIEILCHDGTRLPATLVGAAPEADIAVLKVAQFPGISPVKASRDADVEFGQAVFAIGCPQGMEFSVSRGVVSHPSRHDRNWKKRYGDATVLPILQTDTAINPGNSGGPLFNRRGELVGVNTFIIPPAVYVNNPPQMVGQAMGSVGLGFAIKGEGALLTALRIVQKGGDIAMADTGMTFVRTSAEDRFFCRDARATVARVRAGSTAEKAGFREGDRITSICGVQTPTAAAATTQLFYHAGTGRLCTFQVARAGLKHRKTLRMVVPEKAMSPRSETPRPLAGEAQGK